MTDIANGTPERETQRDEPSKKIEELELKLSTE
jgi:hypothetical protein